MQAASKIKRLLTCDLENQQPFTNQMQTKA